jgi:peptidoglycan/xylan/chitin deacetylase (PgdA/CDA1 family)
LFSSWQAVICFLLVASLILAIGWCGTGPAYCNAPDCQINYGSGCDALKTPEGTSTLTVARPHLGSIPYGGDGIYDCFVPGTIALTFDDGPGAYTSNILDTLDAYNAKATFFITGINNGKGEIDDPGLPWAALIRRIYASGHQIASHTWSHQDLSIITAQQRQDQMVKNEMALRNILGFFPIYMRPP